MNVETILNQKGRGVITAKAGDSLAEVCAILEEKGIGALVVIGGNGEIAGIITERDIVRALARDGAAALSKPADHYMTREVVTCVDEDTIANLMNSMTDNRFRHLPVVRESKLSGIISIGDVVKWRIAEVEFEAQAMREYIATG